LIFGYGKYNNFYNNAIHIEKKIIFVDVKHIGNMDDKKEYKLEIKKNVAFPRSTDPFSEKEDVSWGYALSEAIVSEWFYREGDSCRYYTQRQQMFERRIYAKGLQSLEKFYDKIGTNGTTKFLNLTKKPITIIPKLVDVITNGMTQRDYHIKALAVDPTSLDNKLAFKDNLKTDMLAKDIIVSAKENLGMDIGTVPIDEIPESEEELNLKMDLEYKQPIEKAEELAISVVFKKNRYKQKVERRKIIDQVVLGVCWEKHTFIPDRGIVVDYVDPEYKIQSYTEDPFFLDSNYHGEIKPMPISEVLVNYQWINEHPDLVERLQNAGENWWTYHNRPQNEMIKGYVELLYFTYKTTRERAKKIKEKATGEKVVSNADEKFDETKVDKIDFKRVSKVEEVEFEGVRVLGTDIVLKWEVSQNMVRPKSNKQRVVSQYIGYAPNKMGDYYDSLVARMMPIEDKLNIIELKTEQIIQRIMPDGFSIDPTSLAEIDLGEGGILETQDLLDMFFQTGSVLATMYNQAGDYNQANQPIRELVTGRGGLVKLDALRNERATLIEMMRDVIGLNKASDASSPDKDSLVGLQKLAALNSNTATRHILEAVNDCTERMAEAIVYRTADLLKYSDLRDDFAREIGSVSVMQLELIKDLHNHDFAIFLELLPDDEEKLKLEQDLSIEIQAGMITTEDKNRILRIGNISHATDYLSILRKKREKILSQRKKEEFDYQADANQRAGIAVEQEKQKTFSMEAELKQAVQQMITQGELAKEAERGNQDRMTLEVEYEKKNELQYIVNSGQSEKIKEVEDRKDERLREQATQNSEMIKQRETNGQPKDFQAENVDMDIFKV
jgi:hypothetical protein